MVEIPKFSPGKAYYLAMPRGRKERMEIYIIRRRKNKKILCDDRKVRRFCDGVLSFGGDYISVLCCECDWDFNFHDICERTIPFLKKHVCNIQQQLGEE